MEFSVKNRDAHINNQLGAGPVSNIDSLPPLHRRDSMIAPRQMIRFSLDRATSMESNVR